MLADNAGRRRARQRALDRKIEDLKEQMAALGREKDRLQRDFNRVWAEMGDLRAARRNALEAPEGRKRRLEDEIPRLKNEEAAIGKLDDMGNQYLYLIALRSGTTSDYYAALTNAARNTEDFKAVAARSRDEVCDNGSTDLIVEHVYPRIEIFGIEGFKI